MQSKATAARDRDERNKRKLGRNLAKARRRARLTQKELGGEVSTTQSHISLLERGVGYPRMDTLLRLADALGVPAGQLLSGVE